VLFDKNYDVDLNKAIKSFNKGSGFEEAKQKVVNDVITDLQSIKGRAFDRRKLPRSSFKDNEH